MKSLHLSGKLLITFSVFAMLLFFNTISFSSAASNDVTPQEALKAALFHIKQEQALGGESSWNGVNVHVNDPIEVFDFSGNLESYIINLDVYGAPVGFVEVSATKTNVPILSYAFEGSQMDNNLSQVSQVNRKPEISSKVVSIGPAAFGLLTEYTDGTALVTNNDFEKTVFLDSEELHELERLSSKALMKGASVNETVHEQWLQIEDMSGDIGTNSDGVTDDLSFEQGTKNSYKIQGVGDLDQFTNSKWVGPSGCTPTSATNIMNYWSSYKGKSNLTKFSNGNTMVAADIIAELRTYMETDNSGNTYDSKVSAALIKYAKEHGYLAESVTAYSPTFTRVKNDLSYGPTIFMFQQQTLYGNHAVTGLGWTEFTYNGSSAGRQYMLVHDNWGTTPVDVFISYGRNYSSMKSASFII